MELKTQLLSLLEYFYTQVREFDRMLTPAERQAAGTFEHWSIKDELAHCAFWQKRMADNLALIAAGQSAIQSTEEEEDNQKVFAAYKDDSMEQVLDFYGLSYQALAGQVSPLSEADLATLAYLPWQTNRTLWNSIVGSAVLHPLSHLTNYLAKTGRVHESVALVELITPTLKELSPDQGWQDTLTYNLACIYAVGGRKEQALSILKEVLPRSQSLSDWSRQDTDLDGLRDDPEFQALYS
jgi:hypothetical protein